VVFLNDLASIRESVTFRYAFFYVLEKYFLAPYAARVMGQSTGSVALETLPLRDAAQAKPEKYVAICCRKDLPCTAAAEGRK
jgi:hypothetical protein